MSKATNIEFASQPGTTEVPRYKVLVAVDGSAASARAVKQVIRLARAGAVSAIDLLHVQPTLLYPATLIGPQQKLLGHWANAQARDATSRAATLLTNARITFELHIERGEAPEIIVAHASRHGCDLIVMGTRGMSALGNLVLGSVAVKVLHLSHVPVTLIK